MTTEPAPTVTKEDVAKAVAKQIAGLDIKTAEYISENNGVFITIYGAPGSGKTTLCGALAKHPALCPILYIDVEGGMAVVDIEDIRSGKLAPVQPATFDKIEDVRRAIAKGDLPYKTVVLDNMSEVLTLCKRKVTGDMDSPSQPEWGKITDAMLNMTRAWRDLSKSSGLNVVFIAWDNPDKDEANVVKSQLYFTPALREQFPGIVDIVGHIGYENGKRVLDFAWNPRKTQAKFRRAINSNATKIPEKIPYNLDNLPLGDIMMTLREGKAWPDKYAALARPTSGAA